MINLRIERASTNDHDAIWQIIKPVIAKGDSYAFSPNTTKSEMLAYWCSDGKHCYVAKLENQVLATFIIKDNQPALGAHVANASYMVHPAHHGKGIGKQIGKESLSIAKQLCYKAMQFNLVVKTNTAAVALWEKLGFDIIAEIPEAFNHQQLGYVNAYVMFRKL